MHNRADYRLYLVTDRNCLQQQTLEQAVEQAILGGVTLVQLREKAIASKAFYERALRIKAICHHYNVPLLINDRVDIALAVEADGVHIGQSDLPCGVVRQILGKDKIIGVSARTAQQAIQAQADGADYLGVGAMFATSTKQDAQTVTIASLTQIRQSVTLPIVAIGGINHTTLPALQQALQAADTSIDGVAVVSAILGQKDVKLASQQLKEVIKT
ncbi:thiamine phosphate synthase [Moraxella osloensis]|uniref:Thiamine-phosphate synthase n=1 Tax=Faucicola osloensis TaxID=34062 RepID=A0A6P1KKW4_FAUOS|nr:thiamine phosphate synthase [Moraxella osloensis]